MRGCFRQADTGAGTSTQLYAAESNVSLRTAQRRFTLGVKALRETAERMQRAIEETPCASVIPNIVHGKTTHQIAGPKTQHQKEGKSSVRRIYDNKAQHATV